MCTVCCASEEKESWELVDKIVNPDLSKVKLDTEKLFKEDLKRYLTHKDEESGNYCLHLALQSNNLQLVKSVHKACPSIASIKNKEAKSPKELAKNYSNLKHYSFPKSFHEGEAKVWAIDSDNNVHYLSDEETKTWRRFGDIEIKYVSTSNNGEHVWGVGTTGSAHYLARKTSFEWKTVECSAILDSIAVSADGCHVWAIDVDGNVYRAVLVEEEWSFEPDDASVQMKLRCISVSGDGSKVCGINRADGNCVMKMPGHPDSEWRPHGKNESSVETVSISPNGKLVCFTDCYGKIYRYFMGTRLIDEGKQLRQIVVDNGFNVWGTGQDSDGAVWYRDFHGSNWIDKASDTIKFKQVSSCDLSVQPETPFQGNYIWLVGSLNNRLYHLSHENSYLAGNVTLPGGCDSIIYIASNSTGDIWIVDNRRKLFYRPKNSPVWHFLQKDVGPIAAGKKGGLVWVSKDQKSDLKSDLESDLESDLKRLEEQYNKKRLSYVGYNGIHSKEKDVLRKKNMEERQNDFKEWKEMAKELSLPKSLSVELYNRIATRNTQKSEKRETDLFRKQSEFMKEMKLEYEEERTRIKEVYRKRDQDLNAQLRAYLHYSMDGEELMKHEMATIPLSVSINDDETCICVVDSQGNLSYADLSSDPQADYSFQSTGVHLGNGVFSLSNNRTPLGSTSFKGGRSSSLLYGNVPIDEMSAAMDKDSTFSHIRGSDDFEWGSAQSASMTGSGEHVWAVQENGDLYYMRNKDGPCVRVNVLAGSKEKVSKVSVS